MKSCTSINDLLLLALRMTFGGAPNPSPWSDVSEAITDPTNDLVRRSDWNPEVFHSPHQHLLESDEAVDNDKTTVDTAETLGKADFFAVNYPNEDDADSPHFDCYLDDIFGAFNPRNRKERSRHPAYAISCWATKRHGDNGILPERRPPRDPKVPRGGRTFRTKDDPRLGGRHPTIHCRLAEGQARNVV